jgi:hypothetical protein
VARNLPSSPSTVRAYRLARPVDSVSRARRILGIHTEARRITVDEASWVVAQDGGATSHQPLHSLAVSLESGELIYHDRRNFVLPLLRKCAPAWDECYPPVAKLDTGEWLKATP